MASKRLRPDQKRGNATHSADVIRQQAIILFAQGIGNKEIGKRLGRVESWVSQTRSDPVVVAGVAQIQEAQRQRAIAILAQGQAQAAQALVEKALDADAAGDVQAQKLVLALTGHTPVSKIEATVATVAVPDSALLEELLAATRSLLAALPREELLLLPPEVRGLVEAAGATVTPRGLP